MLLARALAPSPRLLLLDEPLSNLDPYWVLKTLELLRETVRATDCSAIVSLHDIDRVDAFDRVLLVDQGRIAADLPPDEMLASHRAVAKLPDRTQRERLALQARWRVRDHRRELRFGNDLAVDQRAAGKLADAGPLLDELDLEPKEHAGLDRSAEFRPLDGHEIDQLAGVREAERFDREHARRLGERLDDQHARHDRTPREMPLEEPLVDGDRLDRDDRPVELQRFDAVDEQHRITMRQRRHHPPDIERGRGGAWRGAVTGPDYRPCGAALRRQRSSWTLVNAALSAASTSLETSRAVAGGQRRADFDHHVGPTALHHLLIDRTQLGADLLLDIGLVALDLLLLASDFLRGCLLLGLECLARACSAASAGLPARARRRPPGAPWLPPRAASTSAFWRARSALTWLVSAAFAVLQALHCEVTFSRSTTAMTAGGTFWANAGAAAPMSAAATAV